jgi:hypothetical protein
MPHCSPFSEPWMSALDNSLGKSVLGLSYTPFDVYLAALMRDYLNGRYGQGEPLPGYDDGGHRERELELALR